MEDDKDNKGGSMSVKPTKFTPYWGKILSAMKHGTNLIQLLNFEIQINLYASVKHGDIPRSTKHQYNTTGCSDYATGLFMLRRYDICLKSFCKQQD